jgi:type VI secretion system secreted protein Hcp
MAIYMKFEGIEGNVSSSSYRNWIELQSFGNGLSRNVQTVVGAAGEREAGHPHFTEVKITKEQDLSTGDLLRECVANTRGKKVEIDFVATDEQVWMKIELEAVIITEQSLACTGESEHGGMIETYKLSFAKIVYVPRKRYSSGTRVETPRRIGYDLATAKPF